MKNQKKKAISARVGENDMYELKKRALESGVPYQNIIQMLIHQFASNKIQMSISTKITSTRAWAEHLYFRHGSKGGTLLI